MVALGEVVEFLDSQRRPVKASDRVEGEYPYYGANGQQGTIDGFLFDEPLVLLAEDGGHFDNPMRGIAYKISGKSWVNNHAHVLRPTDRIDLDFLCRAIENRDVTPQITGSTRAKLTKKGASRIKIPLPPLPEQKRIAAILDAADVLRAKRRKTIEELDTFLQSVFLDMFGDPVTNPKGWDIEELGSLITVGPQNGLYKPAKLYGEGTRIVRIDGFYHGSLVDQTLLKRVRLIEDEISRYRLSEGDILVNRVNSREYLGKCALIPLLDEPTVFESNMMRLHLNGETTDPTYAVFALQSTSVRHQILTSAKDAVNQSSINQGDVKGLQIPVPPVAEQRKFSSIATAVGETAAKHEAHLTELDTLFASLQSRAFKGEL